MNGMNGVQQRGNQGDGFSFGSGPDQLQKQNVKQPGRARVQEEIQQVVSDRIGPAELPIQRERGERDRPKHVADRIGRNNRCREGSTTCALRGDVEFVVRDEPVHQRVAVDQRNGSQQQRDEETFIHDKPIMRWKRGDFAGFI